jgi:hypothetical protein
MYQDPNSQQPYEQPQSQSPYTSPYEQQYQSQLVPPSPYPPTQYGVPPAPQVQPVYVVPPPQKSSNKTVWIVLGVVLGIILLVGGGCCAAVSLGVLKGSQAISNVVQEANATATADQQTAIADEPSPEQQAQDYYTAIEAQDYAGAYMYLATHMKLSDGTALTQDVFTQKAQGLDNSEGQVTDFTATADPNKQTSVTVQVTRSGGKTYTVHLTFVQGDYQWVIDSFDNI